MQWQIEKIIDVANDLQIVGRTSASTNEQIAAAFVLNRLEYLPAGYTDVVEAWEQLGIAWQSHVKRVKRDYMHLIRQDEGL